MAEYLMGCIIGIVGYLALVWALGGFCRDW